jgi:hypothetical protein
MTLFPTDKIAFSAMRNALFLLSALAIFGMLGGCDVTEFSSSSLDDGSSTSSEVEIDAESVERVDLQFEPVSLSPGETFSIGLLDNSHDRPVARIIHEGISDRDQSLKAHFGLLSPTEVTVRCRNERTGTAQTMATPDPVVFDVEGGLQPVATADNDPDSYHYVYTEDNVIIEVDYDDEEDDSKSTSTTPGPSFTFPSSDRAVQCTHVSFFLSGVSTALSPDGVRFAGGVAAPTVHSKEVQ